MASTDLISTAAIIVGFGVTAMMFRVQRELYVLEVLKVRPVWLAWADYLVLGAVGLAVFGVVVPLLMVPTVTSRLFTVSASVCAAAVVLQAGFIPAILAHYRIEFGARRDGPRAKGEPMERLFVIASVVVAFVFFAVTLGFRLAGTAGMVGAQ